MTRIGSLCTGYGGLDAAVQQVFGGTTAWVSDIDPGARQILAHRMPGIPNLGDLTTTDWDQVEPVDIVTGGYPCQPFSVAGLQKGTADARHIWPWIADALRVLRPRIAVFENVAGHLRLGFDTVLADLARLGFDAEWCLVRASEVGAPHQRNRLFILATAADAADLGHERGGSARRRGAGLADGGHVPADPGSPRLEVRRVEPDRHELPAIERGCGEPAADTDGRRLAGHPERNSGQEDAQPERQLGLDPDGRGVLGPAASHADREFEAEKRTRAHVIDGERSSLGRRTVEFTRAPRGSGSGGGAPAGEPSSAGPDAALQPDGGAGDAWGRFAPAIHRWEAVLGRRAPWATDDRNRLSPAFVEWMQGLPPGWVTDVPGLSRAQQLKALGNGVVPQQAEAAIRLLAERARLTATARAA